eukprot:CAMPEP_0204625862 /NCGR_PEP_ID=MMETSP0717-20131115/11502_1 /ASSEMBLY_ACC=CAM_ASM_000666 /TAXON_ID=230516 /ORGANISM="Chaetoceros curvisetus" /LENGTH=268 /DNA_ID=CAMNT_0051641649 /DNA_START=69 /DNA_END=875 /DNA_ORIENTATION=+
MISATGTSRKKKKAKASEVVTSQPPVGQTMSQLYLCLSPVEQDRLAAFRRSTFPSDAVSSFVATCLVNNGAMARSQRKRGLDLGAKSLGVGLATSTFASTATATATATGRNNGDEKLLSTTSNASRDGTNTNTYTNTSTRRAKEEPVRALSEYVAPGTSSQISIIVSTLAKIYAQRLIRCAREVANHSGYSCQEKLLPQHVLEAHSRRVKNGSDPGFFMQPQDMMRGGLVESFQSPTFSSTWLKEKMDEAREAQELYDKSKSSEKKQE